MNFCLKKKSFKVSDWNSDIIFVLRNSKVRIDNNYVIVQYAVKTFTTNSARKGKNTIFFLQRVILLNYCLFLRIDIAIVTLQE